MKKIILGLMAIFAVLTFTGCTDPQTKGTASLSLFPAGSAANDVFAEKVRAYYETALGNGATVTMKKESDTGSDHDTYAFAYSASDDDATIKSNMLTAKNNIATITSQMGDGVWMASFYYATGYDWTKCDNIASGTWTADFTSNTGAQKHLVITVPQNSESLVDNTFSSAVSVSGDLSFSVPDATFKPTKDTSGDVKSLTYAVKAIPESNKSLSVSFEVTRTLNGTTTTTTGKLTSVSDNSGQILSQDCVMTRQ